MAIKNAMVVFLRDQGTSAWDAVFVQLPKLVLEIARGLGKFALTTAAFPAAALKEVVSWLVTSTVHGVSWLANLQLRGAASLVGEDGS